MKVLIIEDDTETAGFIARGLREAGMTVDCAATGVDGLFLASDGGYDALVVDRMLPQMDGLGLVRMLRATGVDDAGPLPDGGQRAGRPGRGPRRGRGRLHGQALRLFRAPRPAAGAWSAGRRASPPRPCCGSAILRSTG